MNTRAFMLAGLPAFLLCAPPAFACVACDSEAAHQLRHTLFAQGFAPTLLSVVAPFPVLIGAALGLGRLLGGKA